MSPARPSMPPPAVSNMAETSSSPQVGGAGSSNGLARDFLPPASMIPYAASNAPPSVTIGKRSGRHDHDDAALRTQHAPGSAQMGPVALTVRRWRGYADHGPAPFAAMHGRGGAARASGGESGR